MNCFLREIEDKVLVFDGSKGYMLQMAGLSAGECAESWNITHPDKVKRIYKAYVEAGANVIQSNTFPGNRIYLEKYSLDREAYEINKESVRLAKEVMGDRGYVAAAIGPTGELFEPSGNLSFQHAYEVFSEQVKAVTEGGADLINFETFTCLAEMRAALLAAKENCTLPVVFSAAFEENGRTLMGSSPRTVVSVLKSLGADMVGTNCSFGPEQLVGIVRDMSEAGGGYLSVKPNAGLPEMVDGSVIYRQTPEDFARLVPEFIGYGVRLLGGCCGTTPEFVSAIKREVVKCKPSKVTIAGHNDVITSSTRLLKLNCDKGINTAVISGENNGPLLNELADGDVDAAIDLGMDILDGGFDALLVDGGLEGPGSGKAYLAKAINHLQKYVKTPLIIRTKCMEALESTLRLYTGKAGIVSEGIISDAVMDDLFSAADKYGAVFIKNEKLILKNI